MKSDRNLPWPRAAVVVATMLLAACAGSRDAGTATQRSVESKPHPMASSDLRDVMRSFDEVRKDVPGEVDEFDRWEGVYSRIADAAATLGKAANDLAGHPPKLELPDRARFSVRARSLASAAESLQDAAANRDADAVHAARRVVANACQNCHREFRREAGDTPVAFE